MGTPAVDAIQLVRCAANGNTRMRDLILADYGLKNSEDGGRAPLSGYRLVTHMCYLATELASAATSDRKDCWFESRLANLVADEHGDAHAIVDAYLKREWRCYWQTSDLYAPNDPGLGFDQSTPLQELIFEIARLAVDLRITATNDYARWPADFYDDRYRLVTL